MIAVFDQSVAIASGPDATFQDTTANNQITWVGGNGNAQAGIFSSGGAPGNGWQWSPGGGLIVPDTGVVQTGAML